MSAIDEIRAHASGTALWWLGNAGWAIKSDDVLLLIDPVIELAPGDDPLRSEIGLPLRHPLPLRAGDLGSADVALCAVTHAHGDHLARRTIATLCAQTRCRFVTPKSCLRTMRELRVPEERIIIAEHGRAITHQQVTLEPVKALHGHIAGSVYAGANFGDCGYLVSDGRWRIFHPGDTVLLQEHLEMKAPDVFLVSITEHNTWVHNSALLANLWRPRYVVPMHHGTYARDIFWTVGDPEAVRVQLDDAVRPAFRVVEQGQRLGLGERDL